MFVAWLCNDCNLSLTEHAIKNWERLAAAHAHECDGPQSLFPVADLADARPMVEEDSMTRRLYLSNGGGDDRYVSASNRPGYVTVEQLAVICGINANTARDIASGRQGGPGIGELVAGRWMIRHDEVLAYLPKRWKI
jgi:hypothetical protein